MSFRELRYRSHHDQPQTNTNIVEVCKYGVIISLTKAGTVALIPWGEVVSLTFNYAKDDEMVGWIR